MNSGLTLIIRNVRPTVPCDANAQAGDWIVVYVTYADR